MRALSPEAQHVNWMLTTFVQEIPGIEQAIAVSADGLLMAISSNLDRGAADKMAAIVTGMRSLADGASRVLGKGGLNQVIIELRSAYLFISSIGGGSALGVVASRGCDLGLVGYETTILTQRFGGSLTPDLISELKISLVSV